MIHQFKVFLTVSKFIQEKIQAHGRVLWVSVSSFSLTED